MSIEELGAGARQSASSADESIAVVGMSCRFPKASSIAAFWQLLCAGGDAITEVPRDRWDAASLYDPDVFAAGRCNSKWGGFVDQIDLFDPLFFGISPKEAVQLDPQQRLLLQLSWEALEDAGIPPDSLKESRTGVYFGLMWVDYLLLIHAAGLGALTQHTVLGAFHSFAANRVSYTLGLQGPSLVVDTASSSSLVAVHLACESLRRGETHLALAGGISLNLHPSSMIMMAKTGALSPDGRCHTFDARANGYVRGEGGGVVVLKRLAQALAENDPIYCVIGGSAINNDGPSEGIAAPNRQAQQDVLRQAYARAGILPTEVDYVELHGTGTPLGDPIEAAALGHVAGSGRPAERPLRVGSVKTNIGHLEPAAGIAGFIKTALSIKHRQLPPSLHFQRANPQIPAELRLQVQQTLTAWPTSARPALAGVSSFSLGGTNCHVVLQEAPQPLEKSLKPPSPSPGGLGESAQPCQVEPSGAVAEPAAAATPYLLPLSARSAASLLELGREHQKLLAASPETLPQDLAYTASVRRSHHSHRLALVGATPAELQTALATYCAQGSPAPPLAPGQRPKVVFVFSGQGSQWLGMGRQLLREEPQFRAVIAACDRIIQAEAGWSLVAELMAAPTDSRLERIEIVQPALVSLQIALAALWRSWGVTPAAVVGHSMGEVAAAQVCGALSLQDALRIICRRSQLMQRLSGQGAMAMIELGSAEAQPLLRGRQDRLAIAAVNGPRSTVLSGDPRALDEVLVQVEQQKRFFRRVQVEVASHSPQMEPLRADLLAALSAVASQAVTTPMHSTVLGTQVTEGMLDAAYWWRNLREPVLFWPTVERLMQDGHELFVELSPHPIVVPALHEGLAATGRSGTALGSLRREQPERRCLLETLGELYVRGQEVAWAQLYPAGGRCIQLPAYPWQKERYWITEAAGPSAPAAPSLPTPQPAPPPPESPTSREAGSFLTVEWRPLADPAQRQVSRTTGGTWLVFTGDSPVGQAVLAGLRAAGMNCLQVEPGGHFQRLAAGRLQLDPSRPEDYLAVLREAGSDGECAGVLHLWSLGEDPTPTLERLDPEQLRGSRSALLVVQALLQTGWRSLPRLWLVSRGTQGVVRGDAASALAQAPLWGLGQAISTEHPQLVCTAVDLSAAPSPQEAAALVSEVLGPGLAEDQLALRGAVAYVPRLVRSGRGALSEAEPAPLAQDGAYLIEGGLSEPGLATAQWLVERGARHLVLWADGEPAARERQVLGRLQAAGAQIVTECRELAPCEAVAAILGQLRQRRLPLRGVVLAGESAAPASPRSLHEAPFPQALAAQLQRAFCLHSLTTEEPLDFFICYSALAPPDSGSHRQLRLATSAFFDALAEYRQRRGQPAVSVRWGEVPASARDADRADRAAPASPGAAGEKSRQGLFRLLRGAPARLTLMNLDVRQLLEAQPSLVGSSLWQELGRERAPSPGSAGGAPLHKELVGARPAERAARVEEHLRRQLSQVLRLEPTRIERQVPFKKLGLDSLMSFELRNRLEASTGVSLSAVLLFTYPNLAALTSYLLTALGLSTPPEPPPPAAAPAPPSPVGADLDELSEDELVSRLSQKLLNAKPRSK